MHHVWVLHNHTTQGWPMFQQLLISLFKFLAPFLRNAELSKPTHLLYKVMNYNSDQLLLYILLPYRAHYGYCWFSYMISQNSYVTIILHSVM